MPMMSDSFMIPLARVWATRRLTSGPSVKANGRATTAGDSGLESDENPLDPTLFGLLLLCSVSPLP
jgi:hypothetical protein